MKKDNLVKYFINSSLVSIFKRNINTNKKYLFVDDNLHNILIGLLLGDLSAEKPNDNCNTRLQFKQSLINEKYVFHLYSLFKDFCGSPPLHISKFDPRVNKNKVYSAVKFQTFGLPCFNVYKNLFYDLNGKKVIPSNIEKLLTPVGLAYWFMDDGYKSQKGLYICTDSFTLKDIEKLIKVLQNKFDLKCSYHRVTNG